MRVLESDLFEDPILGETVLICPVNVVGVMGKGLALQFKRRYHWAEGDYKSHLKSGTLDVGQNSLSPSFPQIMYMVTKRHWRDPSRKGDVVEGLLDLKKFIKRYPSQQYRLPAVGCGEGGLSFLWLEEQCWTLFSGMNLDLYRPK